MPPRPWSPARAAAKALCLIALAGCLSPEEMARLNAERAARAAEEERRLEALYAQARYGTILQCTVQDGQVDFERWRAYQPFAVTLALGEAVPVEVTAADEFRTRRLWVEWSRDGTTVALCDHPGGTCARMVGTARQYSSEFLQVIEADAVVRYATMRCGFLPPDLAGPALEQRR